MSPQIKSNIIHFHLLLKDVYNGEHTRSLVTAKNRTGSVCPWSGEWFRPGSQEAVNRLDGSSTSAYSN